MMSDVCTYTKEHPPLFCLTCGDPIQQQRRGRTRLYCKKPGCRKAGNRDAIKRQHERALHNLAWKLKKQWEQFDHPTTVWTLTEILTTYGVGAAAQATHAIEQELEARVRNPLEQAQFSRSIRQKMDAEAAERSTR